MAADVVGSCVAEEGGESVDLVPEALDRFFLRLSGVPEAVSCLEQCATPGGLGGDLGRDIAGAFVNEGHGTQKDRSRAATSSQNNQRTERASPDENCWARCAAKRLHRRGRPAAGANLYASREVWVRVEGRDGGT